MKYSALGEDYPDSKKPFDFRPPNRLTRSTLDRLSGHIVKGLKIETEQGIELATVLRDRLEEACSRVARYPEEQEKELNSLPECIRQDAICLINAIRRQLEVFKETPEYSDNGLCDDEGHIGPW